MSSTQFPESDDPFEVLGATPEDGLVEVRRRYVRLIKTYRPETHPAEFERVRKAWESAQAVLRFRAEEGRLETEHGAASAAPAPPRPPTDLVAAWSAAAEGRFDVARRALEDAARDAREAPRAWAHRFLLEELAGASGARRVWGAALERGVGVAPWMTELLEHGDLGEVAAALPGGWPLLRGQGQRTAAVRVFRARLGWLLRSGLAAQAVEEVLDPAVREDSTSEPGLAHLAAEVVAGVVWTDADAARRVLAAYPWAAGVAEELHDHVTLALEGQPRWVRWWQANPDLEPFVAFLSRASVAEMEELSALANDLWSDFLGRPDRWFEGFSTLPPAATSVYLDQVERACVAHGVPTAETPSDLPASLRTADAELTSDRRGSRRETLGALLVMGGIATFWLVGLWGVLFVAAALAGVVWLSLRGEGSTYARTLRPALARYVVEAGASPSDMAEWTRQHAKSVKKLAEHVLRIRGDDALAAMHATTRLGDLLPALEEAAESDSDRDR